MARTTTSAVWAFVALKGGVGKSTLCVHLAVWLARRGATVGVVDADPQLAASTWLAEVAAPGVQVVTAADAAGLQRAVDAFRRTHDVVVVDAPAGLADVARQALLLADMAVVPVGPSALDLRAAMLAINMLMGARQVRGGRLPQARLVLNRTQPWTTLGADADDAVRQQAIPAARRVVRQRTALADACGQATVVFDMPGDGAAAAADDLQHLFLELHRCLSADK
jgi:chromosome partitioning protein